MVYVVPKRKLMSKIVITYEFCFIPWTSLLIFVALLGIS